jgi:hypothetical protein
LPGLGGGWEPLSLRWLGFFLDLERLSRWRG